MTATKEGIAINSYCDYLDLYRCLTRNHSFPLFRYCFRHLPVLQFHQAQLLPSGRTRSLNLCILHILINICFEFGTHSKVCWDIQALVL